MSLSLAAILENLWNACENVGKRHRKILENTDCEHKGKYTTQKLHMREGDAMKEKDCQTLSFLFRFVLHFTFHDFLSFFVGEFFQNFHLRVLGYFLFNDSWCE